MMAPDSGLVVSTTSADSPITIPIIADHSKHELRVFSDNAYPAIPEAQAVL